MYKTTRWYKTGEKIPQTATYIRTEMKATGSKDVMYSHGYETVTVYTEMHLYEIPFTIEEMERKIEENRKRALEKENV